MRNTWAVCKRELGGFFTTPVGYFVVGTYVLITGLGFTISFLFYVTMSASPSTYGYTVVPDFEETFLSPFIVFSGMILMFIGPLVTMRLLAEERNQGTEELLFTHPLRDREIVFGKFGAALGILLAMMSVVIVHVGILYSFVDVEPAVLVLGLVTLFLMGAAFFSMGLFISAVCRNQITAAVLTFGVFFIFYILGTVAADSTEEAPIPDTWPEALRGPLESSYSVARTLITELPLDAHAKYMAQGVVQLSDITYYLLFTAFFLFLTFRALERRRWRA